MPSTHLPEIVGHADWGSEGSKRWIALAERENGSYRAYPPQLVGSLNTLILRLRKKASQDGSVFLGFDFPIGLPEQYAVLASINDFVGTLLDFGAGAWIDFFDIAIHANQVGVRRPFYPYRPGGTNQQHLLAGLGASSIQDLLRICERPTAERGAACSLFWTLGGKQVGRAAIIGWRDVIVPALRDKAIPLSIWPFEGSLEQLIVKDSVVIAETYPAEFYRHLGVGFPVSRKGSKSGKRVQQDRKNNANSMIDFAAKLGVILEPTLEVQIRDGFSASRDGEDPFDAVVGLLGMLNVLIGGRPSGEPDNHAVRTIEGWILGQSSK